MANLPSPSEKLQRYLRAEYYNGFGFQSDGLRVAGTIVFAKFGIDYTGRRDMNFDNSFDQTQLESEIKRDCNSTTAHLIDWIGHDFLAIHYTEWELIPVICNYILARPEKFHFATMNTLQVGYYSCDAGEFSWEDMERRFIKQFIKHAEGMSKYCKQLHSQHPWAYFYNYHTYKNTITYPWNYCTEEGKLFCQELRHVLNKKEHSKSENNNRYTWHDGECNDIFKKEGVYFHSKWGQYKPSLIRTSQLIFEEWLEDTPEQEVELDPEMTCIICMERVANTIVEPCGHIRVCSVCSEGLKNTNDKRL